MKRIIKLLISAVVYCADRFRALVGGTTPSTTVVLYYHGVPDQFRDPFARQMRALVKRANPLSLSQISSCPAKGHHVLVTFDDGFRSVIDNALPALEECGVPAVLFVPTGWLGRPPAWGRLAGAGATTECVLSGDEVGKLAHHELLTFGAHSVSHPRFPDLSPDTAKAELSDAKHKLETATGKPVESFSFPHGAYTSEQVGWAREAGYQWLFSIAPTLLPTDPSSAVVGRFSVEPTDWALEFKLKLAGAYRWMSKRNPAPTSLSVNRAEPTRSGDVGSPSEESSNLGHV